MARGIQRSSKRREQKSLQFFPLHPIWTASFQITKIQAYTEKSEKKAWTAGCNTLDGKKGPSHWCYTNWQTPHQSITRSNELPCQTTLFDGRNIFFSLYFAVLFIRFTKSLIQMNISDNALMKLVNQKCTLTQSIVFAFLPLHFYRLFHCFINS